ncbi:hypothetical protein PR048_009834 [Dryococelus australis]|uniref:RNA-directed DNA polymerase n=1 Tax=Dryococelus australis TaxID=614101 RepID=A0ABQ9I0Z9_9NEOP|nr:hypothetical protein PR048_009834 [Dryococelus australis]
MYGIRVFIPKSLHAEMLTRIPQGHMGIVKCRRRANESVWWPHVSQDVRRLVDGCEQCLQRRVQRVEPLIPTPLLERPRAMFARDYGISYITSSPKYLQSNGAAGSAVAIAKNILMKSQDPNLWLLAYRTTLLESGFSPAELLFGHWNHWPRGATGVPDLKRQGTIQGTAKYPRLYYFSSEAATLRPYRRQAVKVPKEESRKGVPVKATSIQGTADTARPVTSGEARNMMAQPFDQDTPLRDSREESPFQRFPTDGRGKAYSTAEEACSRTRRGRKIAPPQRLDL